MSKNLTRVFEHPEFGTVRIEMDEKGETWFCAKDVCDTLRHSNPSKAIKDHVDEADLTKSYVRSDDQKRLAYFVNESGLYSLILSSKLPNARMFKRWVTSEVLPAIRRDGGYIVYRQDEDDIDVLERALSISRNTIERQKRVMTEQMSLLEELAPMAEYAGEVLESADCLTTTQVAKEMGMTGVELNRLLARMKVQYKQSGQWLLYAEYARMGLAKSRTHCFRGEDGLVHTKHQLVWTERGREFVHSIMYNV